MTRPLGLKSPDNAMALAAYLLTAVLGGSFVLGAASSPGLTLMLTLTWVPVWGLVMMLSGLVGLSAAMTCSHSSNPVVWLKVEQVASFVLGLCWAVYSVATQITPNHTLTGLILFGLLAVAGVWRSAQIVVELMKLRVAIGPPVVTVVVESLADPRDHS